jgi:hypothetical protein
LGSVHIQIQIRKTPLIKIIDSIRDQAIIHNNMEIIILVPIIKTSTIITIKAKIMRETKFNKTTNQSLNFFNKNKIMR